MASVTYQGKPITLPTGQRHVVEVPARILRVRLTGMLFETDKTFLLPRAMRGIRSLVSLYQAHPGMALVITGHTDRVGGPSYNLGLSDERARAIAHYLRDEVDDWLAWYSDQPYSAPWGTREDQAMLSAITDDATGHVFYAGPITGWLDAPTRDAVERYQARRGLAVDGVPGPQTRRALVTDYMQLDGTTLPDGTEVHRLGCGEHHNAVPTADGVAEPDNRRAEIFLFDPPPVEPPAPASCPGAGCPYETWRDRTVQTYDFGDEVLVDWDVFDFELLEAREQEHHGAEA
ncbi:MAG: peptidoglycan-binding protein [Myxococcales bacterium]|nr:peptidoglycan-binding protein [Myxococcales bacterium]